jgi:D-serine deaminase-like pyridoxal phosphate-dependent protein
VIRLLKRRSVPRVADRRAAVVHALRTAGLTLRFVNGGGTGSLETTASEAAVTEVTAGSAFFSPGLFDHYDNFRHAPAVGFAIQIVRRPAPGIFTCLGGGYVASGATGPDKAPVPYLPAGASLLGTEGAGEVQTPIRYSGHEQLSLGDPIFMRHAKAGELCERFTHLLVTADGEVVDEISTYRGDGLCFL